jgi:hypothetical protein
MAVLRVSSGKVYTTYNEINEILAPVGMTVGEFSYPKALRTKVEQMDMSLTNEALDIVFGEVGESVEGLLKNESFDYASIRAGAYIPAKTEGGNVSFAMAYKGQAAMSAEMKESDLDGYKTPHVLRTNNFHFALVNAFVKGVQLADGVQAIIYTTAGELMNLTPTCFNWVVFADGAPVVGLSYFGDTPDAEGQFPTNVTPEHVVLESMKF